jgi:hypothetical protein
MCPYNVHWICYDSIFMSYLIRGFSIMDYCHYFKFLVCVLCVRCGMFCLFVLCILVSSLSISIGRRYFFIFYLSVLGCCSVMFCTVLCVLNDIFICVSLNNFVIFLIYFPLYVKVAHSVFRCCGSVSVFCFCGVRCFMILFIIYLFRIIGGFGLFPSSRIVETIKHDVSETGCFRHPVSGGRHLLRCVR